MKKNIIQKLEDSIKEKSLQLEPLNEEKSKLEAEMATPNQINEVGAGVGKLKDEIEMLETAKDYMSEADDSSYQNVNELLYKVKEDCVEMMHVSRASALSVSKDIKVIDNLIQENTLKESKDSFDFDDTDSGFGFDE